MTCVPVAGPWVVVPASLKKPRPQVQWQLNCPKGYIVGGGRRGADRSGDRLWFLATSGSPVGPGTTTSSTIVFVASYVGSAKPAPTFRPHVGCVPATGGGGRRTPTAMPRRPPARPADGASRAHDPRAGGGEVIGRCHADERLVGAYATRAFRGAKPPAPSVVASLPRGRSRAATASPSAPSGGDGRGVVQIAAVCAGGR